MPDWPIVEITASGIVTAQDGQDMTIAVGPYVHVEGLIRVLYDATDMIRLPSSHEIIEFADDVADKVIPVGFRHAHLRPTEPTAAMWVDHWVAAARNRGIMADVFRNRDAAIGWLMGSDAPA